ncbi:MAG: hypothetical protein K6E75_06075 [Lachnospiraceae bacterium]|nr:hypothetical protein [Lachnospiraceae bacterium]
MVERYIFTAYRVFVEDDTYNERFPITSGGKRRYKMTEEGQQIMCEIMEKLNEETRTETRDSINALNIRLINDNRLDDLRRAATDVGYQTQLLRELFPQRAL